jgi:hypothetical protein
MGCLVWCPWYWRLSCRPCCLICTISLAESACNEVEIRAQRGLASTVSCRKLRLAVVVGWVLQHGEPVVVIVIRGTIKVTLETGKPSFERQANVESAQERSPVANREWPKER